MLNIPDKGQLRSGILKQLKYLQSEEKNQKSKKIQSQLTDLLKNQNGYWAGYQNLSDEPCIQWADVSEKIEWCFPVMQQQSLKFVKSAKTFQKAQLGVSEPIDGHEVKLSELSGIVLPAVAYDKAGYRLGRGQGFYDRALASYAGKKIGVCFEVSLCEQVPHEAHDVQCEVIVTEQSVYQTGCSEGDTKWN